jgi:hypothetical protein
VETPERVFLVTLNEYDCDVQEEPCELGHFAPTRRSVLMAAA